MRALTSSGCQHNPFGCGCFRSYERMRRELRRLRAEASRRPVGRVAGNSGATNSGGFKGVNLKKDKLRVKPWVAMIRHESKIHNLGYFYTPEEAARAYDAAAIRLFGDTATLNFPVKSRRA